MYSSRGSNAYGDQQTYSSQSAYAQKLGTGYSGSSAGGPDGSSQLSMGSRHWSMIGGPQEPDMSGYRTHNPSAGAHYAGQYSSVYGSSGLNSSQQVPQITTKGSGPSALDGRGNYGSSVPDSPKFASGNYVSSSSHGYGRRSDPLLSDKIPDYSSIDRRQYGERQGAYMERDLQIETGRYPDSGGHGLQNQPDMYDRLDQASSVLRQEQLLKAQSLQSAALDRSSRQADYLARGATTHHPAQDLTSYGQRMDADPRSLTLLSGSSYGNQHAASILGAAPRRNTDDLVYAQSSSTPGYGVSLPPGRDYGTGKGLRGASHELDFPSGMLTRSDYPRIDERKDDRGTYARELERREEERHRDYLREREKDREREKERERERERIRIRERERERDRERERERERERILERREKERDKERKRGSEIRRERSPPRISRERHGSSSAKDARTLRRESPLHESSHRRRSPVKEKRREYDCKVYSSSLVNVERDYLSLDKRYPRLFISPECSKVVVNWPRTNLKLPINTPVSFEHDFVEEGARAEQQELSTNLQVNEPLKSEFGTTVWNAKMILMSGLSQNAIEELSSDRSYDDRIPHFCNMLRFAILKKDNSFMAIGGPWSTVDGGDPSDENSLVQTVVRYAKDITHLDLKNCRHWNRFLEIHYDRLGKDGLFSHKEVTVLYVPDLSDCLPSLDAWRDQWLAHKKAISERERHNALKKEKPKEKGGPKDKELESVEVKKENKLQKGKEPGTSGLAVDADKKENDVKTLTANSAEKSAVETDKKIEKKDGSETVAKDSNVEGQGKLEESAAVPTVASVKSGKKKIVKKVVKQKVAIKKEDVETTTKLNDKLDEKDVAEETAKEISQEHNSSSNSVAVKTFTRKKVAKKVPVKKAAQKEDELNHPEKEIISAPDTCEDTSKVESANAAVVQDASSKTTVKKKIIRKVPKRKAAVEEANDKNKDEKNVVQAGDEAKATIAEQAEGTDSQVNEVKLDNAIVTKADLKPSTNEKPNKVVGDDKEEEKTTNEKFGSGSKAETEDKSKIAPDDGRSGSKEKLKEKEKAKDDKEKKDRDGKEEPRSKSNREVKEKKKPAEEPPRRPGLFVQIKGAKDSKLRSLSLSLDSLLDYSENDIDESTFELSLFAEALYEMLQYQMGCRLLTFLQKLRIKFVQKRNQRKRERDEAPEEKDRTSSVKRAKTEDITVENKSNKTETEGEASLDHGKAAAEDATSTDRVEKVKREDGKDEEEDMEEDPEEDEEMPDASAQHESANKETTEGEKTEKDALSDKVTGDEKDGEQGTTEGEKTEKDAISEKVIGIENDGEQKTVNVSGEADAKLDADKKGKVEKKKESLAAVDKELLQAFRFFDRNRVGYVRVEDMRLIIHNLGKFLSHRDVKELVQSALLESNTGRDDRILYNKLVKISDI